MNEEKIKEVFSDEAFVKSLLELDTPERVQKALEEKDIDLSLDEINKIAYLLRRKAEGVLTDEELENVAGGSIGIAALTAITLTLVLTPVVEVARTAPWRW